MSIESIRSQIALLRVQALALSQSDGTAKLHDPQALLASAEEISAELEKQINADAQAQQHQALQYSVMRAFAESIGMKEASGRVLQAVCEAVHADIGLLWIYDRGAAQLHVGASWELPDRSIKNFSTAAHKSVLAKGEGLPGTVHLTVTPVWIPDINIHPNVTHKAAAIKARLQSELAFPIRAIGQVTGVIECLGRQITEPTAELLETLDALGTQIGELMEHKRAEDLLSARIHQQAILAHLGQRALLDTSLQELFNETSANVAKALSVEFTQILELIPEGNQLLLRAGVGWKEGLLGSIYEDVESRSQTGYSLSVSKPVTITVLDEEKRFKPSAILIEHGVKSGLSVIIPGPSAPFGILGAYSTKHRTFTDDDNHFLQSVAHLLGTAIQRHQFDVTLRQPRNEIAVILNGVADGITAQNPSGQIIYANDAAARILGYASAEEFLHTPLERVMPKFDVFGEDGQPLPPEHLPGRQVLNGETVAPLTIRFKIRETGEEHWSVVKAQPVKDASGQVVMAVNLFQDVTELKRAELTQRLLAEVGNLMETSLDYDTRLTDMAALFVPRYADWCAIDILDEKGVLQRAAVAHVNPDRVKLAIELHLRFPPDPKASTGLYNVIRTNRAQLIPMVTHAMIEAIPDPEIREIAEELSLTSSIQVPLYARGHALGAFTMVWAESGYHYTHDDLVMAEAVAGRAAMALDNARLYTDLQRLNEELEQRVRKRTNQLQKANLRLKDEIKERHQAAMQIHSLNAELEQRVIDRTLQLENANSDLQHEILVREQADQALQLSLSRTRELYEVSQNIGLARQPEEVLAVLLASSFLKSAIRASVALFDRVWEQPAEAPGCCTILSGWDKDPTASLDIGKELSLLDYGLIEPFTRDEPLSILDVRADPRLPEPVRQRLLELNVASSVIFPLIAVGDWYGLLSFHFEQARMLNNEDIRHLRGLVDEAANAIYNFRLLQAEAAARREAEEANNLKLKFLAMISHELRTPLTSIKGFATTLLAEDVLWEPEYQRDFLETIDAETDKLTDLIEQLLDLSRLEAGTMRIAPQSVSWEQILSTAMAQLRVLTSHHTMIVEAAPELPMLKVDLARVAQVITNLVHNAVKYSPPNKKITILATRLSDQFIKVSVSDEGQGIPQAAHNYVFEAFQQLDREKGGTQGAGLGLAIARGLIEAHGGRIWVDDHTGPGATISFTLPVDISSPRSKS